MSRRLLLYGLSVAAVAMVVAVFFRPILGWAQVTFGFRPNDANSESYLFWSGIGSDLAYLSVIGAAVIWYRKENCKKRWCPLLGHYELSDADGIIRRLCWFHHPDVRHDTLTKDDISQMHKSFRERHPITYLGDKPGKG